MKGSLKETINYTFSHRIAKNACTTGRFDDNPMARERIVVGTTSGKVVIQDMESIFHVNEPVTALSVFPSPNNQYDNIVVGTKKSLLMFDVFNNKTVFHKDMPEGINVIVIGHIDEFPDPLIVCGCGTTIWGVNSKGEDIYWTTLGDEINALTLCDIDADGKVELIAGTSGSEIKVLKNASLLKELMEGEPTTILCTIQQASFAFGLANGVIGIYRRWERMWRVKTKNQIAALLMFPKMDDDSLALTCVWHNGKIDVRNIENGENYRKSQLEGDVMCVFSGDIQQLGKKQLLVGYGNGKVRGVSHIPDEDEQDSDLAILHEYGQKKHTLMEELKNYEAADQANQQQQKAGPTKGPKMAPTIPTDTQMECTLELAVDRGLLLHIKVSNNIPIKAVLMFAEGIFPAECYAIHPNVETPSLTTMIKPVKNSSTEILIRVFVGVPGSNQLQVLEFDRSLPRFSTQVYFPDGSANPEGFMDIEIGMKKDQVNRWLLKNFLVSDDDIKMISADGEWSATFCDCYTKEFLSLEIGKNGQMLIRHSDIQMVGEIVQSLVTTLDLKQYNFRASFPTYQKELADLIEAMPDLYAVSDKLTAEWTERLNLIRETVVRAEDMIATKQLGKARKMYIRVALLNRECVTQRMILTTARENLVAGLKNLNQMIKLNAQLRVGEDANDLVTECRRLVSAENFSALSKRLLFSSI